MGARIQLQVVSKVSLPEQCSSKHTAWISFSWGTRAAVVPMPDSIIVPQRRHNGILFDPLVLGTVARNRSYAYCKVFFARTDAGLTGCFLCSHLLVVADRPCRKWPQRSGQVDEREKAISRGRYCWISWRERGRPRRYGLSLIVGIPLESFLPSAPPGRGAAIQSSVES